jgi:hypothetical protein
VKKKQQINLGLRQALTQNLNIVWNKKFTKYEENESRVIAYFEDGTTAEGCYFFFLKVDV